MEKLYIEACEACKKGALKLNSGEVETLLREVDGWSVIEVEGVQRLQKKYTFKNFKLAMKFTNKVADVAEQEGHHPVLVTEWGVVSVMWWTHKIGGLHRNDFVMASKSDELF